MHTNEKSAARRIDALRETLRHHEHLYYVLDSAGDHRRPITTR
jgi:NAD-dependent DNA ligase